MSYHSASLMEKIPRQEASDSTYESVRNLSAGDTLSIGGVEYPVERVEAASEVAVNFGLKINRYVPIYYLIGQGTAQGGYHPEADIVVMYENNTDPTTLEHELIHAVEYKFEPTQALLELFAEAKEVIDEDAFDDGFFNFNFVKNIHEFIAEGKTKLAPALKKVGLLENFTRETAYIFD